MQREHKRRQIDERASGRDRIDRELLCADGAHEDRLLRAGSRAQLQHRPVGASDGERLAFMTETRGLVITRGLGYDRLSFQASVPRTIVRTCVPMCQTFVAIRVLPQTNAS